MRRGPLRATLVGFALVATFLPARRADAQQPPAIEIALPRQIVRGQTTVVHVAIPSREVFQGAEVSPGAGVTVAGVSNLKRSELSQNVAWWDVTPRTSVSRRRLRASRRIAGRSSSAISSGERVVSLIIREANYT